MAKETVLFVDGDKYEWNDNKITGAQLRQLAGIPQNALIFLKVPGKPDVQILDDTTEINLKAHQGDPHFTTQSPGSQAG